MSDTNGSLAELSSDNECSDSDDGFHVPNNRNMVWYNGCKQD